MIPNLGRSSGGGYGNPLQYSSLENPHGQRSLVGDSSWGPKELGTAEVTARHPQPQAQGLIREQRKWRPDHDFGFSVGSETKFRAKHLKIYTLGCRGPEYGYIYTSDQG